MPASATPLFPWMTRDEVFRIETPRLWLRWSRPSDANALHMVASQASVATMTATWPHPLPEGEAARRIAAARDLNANGEAVILALTLKGEPDRLIGQIGCNALPVEYMGIGYIIDPGLSNRGIATEAVRGFIDALFTFSPLKHFTASCRTVNPASKRVLEKNGFLHKGRGMLETDQRGPVEVEFLELSRVRWRMQALAAHHAMLQRAASHNAHERASRVERLPL